MPICRYLRNSRLGVGSVFVNFGLHFAYILALLGGPGAPFGGPLGILGEVIFYKNRVCPRLIFEYILKSISGAVEVRGAGGSGAQDGGGDPFQVSRMGIWKEISYA